MTDPKFVPETASAFSEPGELATDADNTAEGLYPVFALRDQPAGWIFECVDQIERLRELKPNWNSYGANPINFNSIVSARRLVRGLSEVTGIDRPRVSASPAGYVALSWEWDHHSRELDLEVRPDGTLRYAYIDEEQPSDEAEGETTDPSQIAHLLTKW